MKTRFPAVLALALLTACTTDPSEPQSEAAAKARFEPDLSRFDDREIHEPQFVIDGDGTPLLIWREKGQDGSDLYLARRGEDGRLGPEVRVNDDIGRVASFPHDEMRAAVAVGTDSTVAIAWTDSRSQVRAAVSRDGGRAFEPSIRLEQTDAEAYRGFPAIAFDDEGVLHAVWIDSRYAEGMAEEPADLFYGRVLDGEVSESNLTAEQEPSVCGCCRTYLEVPDGRGPRALFRNTTADGYRDIFTVTGNGSEMTTPRLIGQPLWELHGCPMAGPIAVGEQVLWPDGSSGRKLLMVAGFGSEPARPLLSDEQRGEWVARLSPRAVAASEPATTLVLLPGGYSSRIVTVEDGTWTVVAEDLPRWATSAYYENGSLLLIGAVDGAVETARQALEL